MVRSRTVTIAQPYKKWSWAVLVVLTAILPYVATVGHGFVFDDLVDVVNNRFIQNWTHLGMIFKSSAQEGAGVESQLYRPIATLSYMVNFSLTGLDPTLYHVINIGLHAGVSLLVMLLTISLGLTPVAAGLAGILFAVHPVHVEVVANVAGRKESLMAFFLLAAILVRSTGLEKGGARPIAAALLYLLATLCKETGVMGLPLIMLWDRFQEAGADRQRARRRRISYAWWIAALLVYLALRWTAVGALSPAEIPFMDNPAAHQGTVQRLLTAVVVFGRGLKLLFFPQPLSPDYSYNALPLVQTVMDLRFILTLTALGLLVYTAIRLRRSLPILGFALIWHSLALLPASNVPVAIGTVFGDRLLYLPSIGLCVTAGAIFALGIQRFGGLFVVGALILLGLLGFRSGTYAAVWRDNISLFQAALQVVPNSAKVRYNLGTYYAEAGRIGEAEQQFRAAVEIYPEYSSSHNQLGNVYLVTGRPEMAKEEYELAVEYDDRNAEAHYNLALRLDADGHRAGAAEHFRRFLELAASAYPDQSTYAGTRLQELEITPRYP